MSYVGRERGRGSGRRCGKKDATSRCQALPCRNTSRSIAPSSLNNNISVFYLVKTDEVFYFSLFFLSRLFRCVLASLFKSVSVRPFLRQPVGALVGPSHISLISEI